jgi:phosphatidate cytidylyltransferase
MAAGSGGLALARADGAPSRWGDLRKRVASALVLGPLSLLCLWFGGAAYVLLLGVGALGIALEWTRMCGYRPTEPAALAATLTVLLGMGASVAATPLAGLLLLAVGGAACFGLARAAGRSGIVAAGVPYAGLAGIALLWLRADPVAGRADILFLVVTVWASDIGAYMVGRWIGGPKLAPRISPGKTWSGAVGGLVFACACGLVMAALVGGAAVSWHAAAVAGAIGVTAQAGDLLESQIKRHFGVKDSGHTIPGHGGLLDRLDGLLTAGPAAALLALALGRGVVLWQ